MQLLIDRVIELGCELPDATAMTFANDRGRITDSMSRADAMTEAARIADLLRDRCGLAAGDRAILAYSPGLDFVRGLLGCLAIGVLGVPVYPPDPLNPQGSIERLQRVANDCGAKAVLTDRLYARAQRFGAAKSIVSRSSADRRVDLPWFVTSRRTLDRGRRSSFRVGSKGWVPDPQTPAFIQYTSGSTSDPKGVIVTHENLASQLDFNHRQLEFDRDSHGVMWLPQYHDLGLLGGILSALFGYGTLTMISPLSFLRRPALWFELMHRERATHTGAPNFAYDLAVRKTTNEQRAQWDLSPMQMMMTAAEVVRIDTTSRFLDAFAVSKLRPEAFCPAYGLAEHTVGVTAFGRSAVRVDRCQLETRRLLVPVEGQGGQVLVGLGKPPEDSDLQIVDPELHLPLPAGQVGEIWVDSARKAAGYWGRSQATKDTFHGALAGPDNGRTYLRTGDLGLLHDGELYVCGRIKDLLILGGRNIHPQDLEDSLRDCHPAVRPGGIVAFAVDDGDCEALAVLLEVRPEKTHELSAIAEAVRTVISKEHQLQCAVVALGPPGIVSKTTSGKVQRSRCRARLCDGTLEAEALLVTRFSVTQPADLVTTHNLDAGQSDVRDAAGASAAAGADHALDEVLAIVREQLAAVLKLRDSDVDDDEPLGAQGLNSAGVVEFVSRLSRALGRDVNPATVMEHPTVKGLAQILSSGQPIEQLEPSETQPRGGAISTGFAGGAPEPVAIVGMACRFGGGVDSPASLWELVVSGGDVASDLPVDRGWDLDEPVNIGSDPAAENYRSLGGYISDVTDFDAEFFEIGAAEARAMDPKQRLLLECAWEAFEGAGIDPSTVRGSDTAVYFGSADSTFSEIGIATSEDENILPFLGTGQAPSMAAGRISYFFGFEGPAVTLDTACSSSLVAIHEAAKSLRLGECSLALAGGATVLPGSLPSAALLHQIGSAPDGRCKSFAAAADGTGWAEGAGLIVLERLSDARRRHHPVLAVVRGSAVNHDGASNGPGYPNGSSQRRLIRRALANAGVQAADVDIVEAHSSGAPIGDVIEAEALIATYGHDRRGHPLWLGSVKSNLGHTQAAAGVGGVIKMVQAIHHGVIPPTRYAEEPNPFVDWSAGAVQLAAEPQPWPRCNGVRRAGVSALSMTGTNAHLILEEDPEADISADAATDPRSNRHPVLSWLITAKSAESLPAQAARLTAHLEKHQDIRPIDIGYSLASSRAKFQHRAVIVGHDRSEMLSGLRSLASGEISHGTRLGLAETSTTTLLLFPGEGAQSAGMGKELYSSFPVYAEAFDEVCSAFGNTVGMEVRRFLSCEPGSDASEAIDDSPYLELLIFATEVALFRLAESWGVRPDLVLGHSVGEVTAAYISGLWSLEDVCILVAERSRLTQSEFVNAGMLSVAAPEDKIAVLMDDLDDRVTVSARDSSNSFIVCGTPAMLNDIAGEMEVRGARIKPLRISDSIPSTRLDPAKISMFAQVCRDLTYRTPRIRVVSGVTGTVVDPSLLSSAQYWVDQLLNPAQLVEAIRWSRLDGGITNFIEVGPGTGLTTLIKHAFPAEVSSGALTAIPLLPERHDEPASFMRGLGAAYVHGARIDWAAGYARTDARRVELPTYAFQRRRLWPDPDVSVRSSRTSTGAYWSETPKRHGNGSCDPVRTDTERLLASAIEEVLGVASVGRTDTFLALGGDSVSATKFASRMCVTGVPLTPKMIFENPTVMQLAAALDSAVSPTAHDFEDEDADSVARAAPDDVECQPMTMSGLSAAELAALRESWQAEV